MFGIDNNRLLDWFLPFGGACCAFSTPSVLADIDLAANLGAHAVLATAARVSHFLAFVYNS